MTLAVTWMSLSRQENCHSKRTIKRPSFFFTSPWCLSLLSTVTSGLSQIVTNFNKMAGQLSGPIAIVAAGSEIARTDAAGLFQVRC